MSFAEEWGDSLLAYFGSTDFTGRILPAQSAEYRPLCIFSKAADRRLTGG